MKLTCVDDDIGDALLLDHALDKGRDVGEVVGVERDARERGMRRGGLVNRVLLAPGDEHLGEAGRT